MFSKVKKSWAIGIMALTTIATIGAFTLLDNSSSLFKGKADPTSYSIVFEEGKNILDTETDDSNQNQHQNVLAYTEMGSPIHFDCMGMKPIEGAWQKFGGNGYFENVDPIEGITSFTIKLKDNANGFTVYYGIERSYSYAQHIDAYGFDGESFTYVFEDEDVRYLKIDDNTNQSVIVSLTINYTCISPFCYVSVESEEPLQGDVSLEETTDHFFPGTQVTVKATPRFGYKLDGWYYNNVLQSTDYVYTFNAPHHHYNLVAKWVVDEDFTYGTTLYVNPGDSSYVAYGVYPQTHVNDSELLTALNSISTPEANGYYLYDGEYYAKITDSKPMWDNIYRKPLVKFTTGVDVYKDTTYWFKCEPISWYVTDETETTYTLLSDICVDAMAYDTPSFIGSNIHTYLNSTFLDRALYIADERLNEVTIDETACKVYIPSYEEAKVNKKYSYNYTSDYALAYGAYPNVVANSKVKTDSYCNCWTRTFKTATSAYVFGISTNYDYTYTSKKGIRPMITVSK